jgi:hypothetical protein
MNIAITGGLHEDNSFAEFAGVVGEIYGEGEYSVMETDLLLVAPDITNTIMVVGGVEKPTNFSRSASTVEVELLNLFNFPKKKIEQKKPRRRKLKMRGGDSNPADSGDIKLHDIIPYQIPDKDLSEQTVLGSGEEDYDIAKMLSTMSDEESSEFTEDQ